VFNFTEEELENRTAINKALKRRWSTESTDSMKITKAQQKIRRFSAFEAEGTQIYTISCQIFVLPSTGFEPTPLLHCSTTRLALRPAP
jgi:hypothetical protein